MPCVCMRQVYKLSECLTLAFSFNGHRLFDDGHGEKNTLFGVLCFRIEEELGDQARFAGHNFRNPSAL